MRAVALLVVITLAASPAIAQQPAPIRAGIEKAAETTVQQPAAEPKSGNGSGQRRGLFWSGLAVGVAGVTTSALGLTVLRTEDSSTGNAPLGTYQACVAQRNSSPIYAANQCDGLRGKNLKLLWGGVALSGLGAALMIGGLNTSAEVSAGSVGFFHRWRF
jgi:hypothetical protein